MESDMKSSYYLIFISLLLLAGCSSHGDASAQSQSNGMAVAKAAFDSAQYEKAERLYLALLSSDASLGEAQLMLARTRYQQDKSRPHAMACNSCSTALASRHQRRPIIWASSCSMMGARRRPQPLIVKDSPCRS